jgi:hypothetical protein
MSAPVMMEHGFQYSTDEWTITFIDKLIGVEIVIHTWDGETPVASAVIPPEHVGSLVKTIIRMATTGSVNISGADRDRPA